MAETMLLSPEELYYLGWLMKEEYIDYAYVAAAQGLGGNFRLFTKMASAALAKKGILQEDFSGELELDFSAARLLRPIFFGGSELTVDLCKLTGDRAVTAYKFHFFGELAVMVHCQADTLAVSETDSQGILETVAGLLPQGQAQGAAVLSTDNLTQALAVKSVCLGRAASRAMFLVDANGAIFREGPEGRAESLQAGDVLAEAKKMLEECGHGISG